MRTTTHVIDNHLQCFNDGDHAFMLWTAETSEKVYEPGTDTFFVRDGKIVVQSFAAWSGSKG